MTYYLDMVQNKDLILIDVIIVFVLMMLFLMDHGLSNKNGKHLLWTSLDLMEMT